MKKQKTNKSKNKISKEQESQSEKISGLLSEIGKLNIKIQLLERELETRVHQNKIFKEDVIKFVTEH